MPKSAVCAFALTDSLNLDLLTPAPAAKNSKINGVMAAKNFSETNLDRVRSLQFETLCKLMPTKRIQATALVVRTLQLQKAVWIFDTNLLEVIDWFWFEHLMISERQRNSQGSVYEQFVCSE